MSASATETAPANREPAAVGDGAGVGLDDERAVLVEPAGRHLVDDADLGGEPQQVAVAHPHDVLDAEAAAERGVLM